MAAIAARRYIRLAARRVRHIHADTRNDKGDSQNHGNETLGRPPRVVLHGAPLHLERQYLRTVFAIRT